MRRARFALPLLLALAATLPGCSLFSAGSRAEVVDVVVDNNLQIPTPVTIYVINDVGRTQVRDIAEIGSRQLVGNVSPGRRSTLSFRSATITGNYRLVAHVASQTRGNFLVSNVVALTGGETVTWELRNNVIVVAR